MSRRALGITLAVAGVGLILDQATKAMATAWLHPWDHMPVLGNLLSLTLVYNPGAAFSLGAGSTWILTVLSVLAVGVTVWFATRMQGIRWGIALGLVLGGTIGNLVDRLVNPPSFGQGHVTDFIAYGDLFVGNVADILLMAGFALIAVIVSRSRAQPDGAPDREDAPERVDVAVEGRP